MRKSINCNKITAKYKKVLIQKIKEFVAIDSTYDESSVSEENPFGMGVSKALDYFATLAYYDGFKVKNYDNKVVEAITGNGPKNITIMAHADVVPVGEGWSFDPFQVKETKTHLYGRGVADDKGPCLAAYYALKALKDEGLLGDYQVRFLVGGNEERGSLCMDHYFNVLKKPQPTYGFSPDSNFPLIFAEKGIINFEVNKTFKIPGVISISGGVASNSVIDTCIVKFDFDGKIITALKDKKNVDLETKDDVITAVFKGIAAHGATPQLGRNAALYALKTIYELTENSNVKTIIDRYDDVYGNGIGAAATSKAMGKNSLNVGLISYQKGKFSMTVNFRHVETVSQKLMITKINKGNEGFTVKILSTADLLFFDKKSPLVKTLLEAYRSETHDRKSQPIAIGGGTYAKEARNVVAFGMEFPWEDAKMHGIGENVCKHSLYEAMNIYAKAIFELGKLIDNENKI